MKKTFLLIVILSLFVFSEQTFSQSLKIGGGGGITVLTNDDATTAISEGGLGLGTGINYGAKAKLGIPLMPFYITASAYLHPLASEETYAGYKYEFSQTLTNYSIGVEMVLIPGPFKPYLSADFIATNFGEATYKIDGIEISTSEAFSRQGIAIGAGMMVTLLPVIDVEVSAKYLVNNMFGKEEDETNFNSFVISANVLFDLL